MTKRINLEKKKHRKDIAYINAKSKIKNEQSIQKNKKIVSKFCKDCKMRDKDRYCSILKCFVAKKQNVCDKFKEK